MGERITEREAARRLGKQPSSLQHQRARGNFAFGKDGLLDWDEVQASYVTKRPAAHPETTRREQHARVTSAVVKANFGKVRLEHIERSYTERAVAQETLRQEISEFARHLLTIPARSCGALVLAFDLSESEATAILTRVMATALGELGDVATEAEQIMELSA
jgi:hypothetical protein